MLQYRGFVQQDPRTKAYLPGTALTGVAFSILQRFDFRAAVRPVLERLNAELGETVHLGMLVGATVHFVDAIESPKAVRVASRLGQAMPASSTSTGKALLAGLSDEEIDALYPRERLDGLTPKSITLRSDLHRQLAIVRKRGYATSSEESEAGVSSVAAALRTPHGPRLAVNVAVPTSRMTRDDEKRIGATLVAVAADASNAASGGA
jgi:DNA-binding IclR family transcriptional regulator